MAQSLSKIYIHLIFHIKTTSPAIRQEDIERVHCYVGQLVNTTGCKVVRVGGVNDHVHILFLLSRDVAISHVVEEIKRNSSRWIKTLATHYRAFAWQNGYGVFSVSQNTTRRMCLRIKAFALTGRVDSTMRKPQGVASLALGCVHHWAFSPLILNPK